MNIIQLILPVFYIEVIYMEELEISQDLKKYHTNVA